MAESNHDEHKESWAVPFRIGAISGVMTPVVLVLIVLGCGAIYRHSLRPALVYSVTPQPAPGLETAIHPGTNDPEVAMPPTKPDPAITRAKREIVAGGLAGWESKP
ncbi:MAG: hypothetical protein ACTHKR_10910 [Sphingomonas sp.]